MRQWKGDAERLSVTLMLGISQRNYEQVARTFFDSYGMGASTVGRTFLAHTKQALEAFKERRFDAYDFVGIWLDGKHFREHQIIVCKGLTSTGEKVVLDFVQASSENAEAGRSNSTRLTLRSRAIVHLMEGMEETLTLQRLGVAGELGQSLRTTNCMENLNSRIGDRLRNVKRWVNTDQLHRWMAMALTEIEPKLHRIPNAEYLPKLRAVLYTNICQRQQRSTSNRLRTN